MHHFIIWILCTMWYCVVAFQAGPDPWNIGDTGVSDKMKNDEDIPPDLKFMPLRKVEPEASLGHGEWFFRRILGIVLKGGQVKKNEDGSTEISLQMRMEEEDMTILDGLLKSSSPMSKDMYRRAVGYIEQAIYQPSIGDKIAMAWSDHVQIYLTEYKTEIAWGLGVVAVAALLLWLWNNMSHKHLLMSVFLALYLYEAFVSYKEAEKQELDTFLAALNTCKWYNIWSSQCEVPKPNPLLFFKHMNPLKIALRIFTTLISEPMIILSDTMKTLVQGMTDGLWYPFDKIVYGILIITFNVLLIFVLITVVFNYIFNIPIDLGYLGVSLSLKQRRRNLFSDDRQRVESKREAVCNHTNNENSLSNSNLERVLDICARALNTVQGRSAVSQTQIAGPSSDNVGLRRSASTGRLPNLASKVAAPAIEDFRSKENLVRFRKKERN